jgi:biuret amidohydrolase
MEINPRTTAVIAVHMQNDIVSERGGFGSLFAEMVKGHRTVASVNDLLAMMREAGALMAYTRVAFKSDYSDMVPNSPLLLMTKQQSCLVEGTWQTQVVAELTPREGDVVITHQRISGFAGTQLDVLLRSRGVDTVLVAGVATNLSVEGTARDASNLGFRTVVVSDACAAASEAAHRASIETLALLGEVATLEEIRRAVAAPTPYGVSR